MKRVHSTFGIGSIERIIVNWGIVFILQTWRNSIRTSSWTKDTQYNAYNNTSNGTSTKCCINCYVICRWQYSAVYSRSSACTTTEFRCISDNIFHNGPMVFTTFLVGNIYTLSICGTSERTAIIGTRWWYICNRNNALCKRSLCVGAHCDCLGYTTSVGENVGLVVGGTPKARDERSSSSETWFTICDIEGFATGNRRWRNYFVTELSRVARSGTIARDIIRTTLSVSVTVITVVVTWRIISWCWCWC